MGAFASQQNGALDFRDGSTSDISTALIHVRFTPENRQFVSALAYVRFGPEADITELGCHQRLDFTSLIAGPVAPLPFHRSPLSSSKPKQLG